MSVKTYSMKTQGNIKLTENFTVNEFAQKDGKSDTVLIDSRLPEVLQRIRDKFQKPIRINSGYRTAAYNKAVKGATNSLHIQGTAADIAISGVTPFDVACAAEEVLCAMFIPGGIGQYDTFTHVDVRGNPKWRENMVTRTKVNGFGKPAPAASRPTLRLGSKGPDVVFLQQRLNANAKNGDRALKADGVFGAYTGGAVRSFQFLNGLEPDGIVGPRTWEKLGG